MGPRNPTESVIEIWKNRWKESDVQNVPQIEDPLTKVPDFDIPRALWFNLNSVWTEQGFCPRGEEQAIEHIIESCSHSNFSGGIKQLRRAETDSVAWVLSLKIRLWPFSSNFRIATRSPFALYLSFHIDKIQLLYLILLDCYTYTIICYFVVFYQRFTSYKPIVMWKLKINRQMKSLESFFFSYYVYYIFFFFF